MSKTVKPLTNEQLKAKAPSLFQDQPYHEVSSKYHFIPTIDIIEQLRAENWYPVSVNEAGVKNIDKFVIYTFIIYICKYNIYYIWYM